MAEWDSIIEAIELEKNMFTLYRDVITKMEEIDQAESAAAAAVAVSTSLQGNKRVVRESADTCASCSRPEIRTVVVGADTDSSLEVEIFREKLDDADRLMVDLESQLKRQDKELVRLKLH